MSKVVLPEERIPLLKRALNDLGYKCLYWDLESSPNEGYWFDSKKPQYMSYKQIKKGKETKIITIQYMWEDDLQTEVLEWDFVVGSCDCGHDFRFDDTAMVEQFITKVMRKYDIDKTIIVGQNHKAFDHRLLNERAKVGRTTPPVNNTIKIDTLKHSKSSFNTASHSLNARSIQYGLGGKLPTDFSTWTNLLEGVTVPQDEMIPYGVKDVTDLRTIMWNDLPYYESLPAPLEKILLRAKAKCLQCEKNKKEKYNIKECKVESKNGFMCLNCGGRFIL